MLRNVPCGGFLGEMLLLILKVMCTFLFLYGMFRKRRRRQNKCFWVMKEEGVH